jgi:hypothetical protein
VILYRLASKFRAVLDCINHLVESGKDVFLGSVAGCELRIAQGSLQVSNAHLTRSTAVQVLEDGEELCFSDFSDEFEDIIEIQEASALEVDHIHDCSHLREAEPVGGDHVFDGCDLLDAEADLLQLVFHLFSKVIAKLIQT